MTQQKQMTPQGRKNCEAVGKRVYEMIHDLCKKGEANSFVSQKTNIDFGKGPVSLTLIIVKPNTWEMFQEFVKERGLHEVQQPAERA